MKAVWKYPIAGIGHPVKVPCGARFLSAQMQDGSLCVLALVDPDAPLEVRQLLVVGTGQPFPGGEYIGTVQRGPFVWHVFEVNR